MIYKIILLPLSVIIICLILWIVGCFLNKDYSLKLDVFDYESMLKMYTQAMIIVVLIFTSVFTVFFILASI